MLNIFLDKEDLEIKEWIGEIYKTTQFQFITKYDELDKDNTISFISHLQISQIFDNPQEKADLVDYYCNHSNMVFVIETEINVSILNLIKLVKGKNVHWVLPGFIAGINNTIHHGWHINQTVRVFNIHRPKLTPYTVKPLYFDALLGTNKPHRNYLYDYLINQGLADKIILKYHGRYNVNSLLGSEHFEWDTHSRPFEKQIIFNPDRTSYYKEGVTHSTENVEYFGQSVRLSQIIPETVYNKSAYSIITESFINNDFTFFTEKITKALLGRRLFVVISGVGYLENLRRLGFKTFENVIDESYDQVEDDKKRFDMVIEQIEQLLQKDQVEVLLKIKDICEHNYELVMSGSLHTAMLDGIRNKINE